MPRAGVDTRLKAVMNVMDSVPARIGSGIVSLKKNDEFQRVFKKGRFAAGRHMTFHVLPNGSRTVIAAAVNRLGISVSRKAGNSVRRNRLRRLFKENYRLLRPLTVKGYDIVVAARPTKRELPKYDEIRREMQLLMRRLGIIGTTVEPETQETDAGDGKTDERG